MEKTPHHVKNIYELRPSKHGVAPLVLDSPHSGTIYPPDFNFSCPIDQLRLAEDQLVDLLYEDAAQNHDIGFLKALFPRTYIDVNRNATDINPDLLSDPQNLNFQLSPTQRSNAGHGLIRETVGLHTPIYNRKLTALEIENRLNGYYSPYHAALKSMLDDCLQQHGMYFHINCHSMPSSAVRNYYMGPSPDFILGDMDGTSCTLTLRRAVQFFLMELGYRVTVNVPYKGVEIVRRYGDPARGKNSLQIEINKSLYINEQTGGITNSFNRLKSDIDKLIQFCAHLAQSHASPLAAD